MAPWILAMLALWPAAALPRAAPACADKVLRHTACARHAYQTSRAASSDACCALCASDEKCVQWSFHAIWRRCSLTGLHESAEVGPMTFFSTCGLRGSPPGPPGKARNWAVIVAGSNSYMNYRHQADACHAYQIVKANGIEEDRIILMAYDDIADDSENPFRGKLFNKPDPEGPGKDVYAGCKIDYRGKRVTPENFLGVLSGKGRGKVLRSSAEDHVFVYFADHGATGLIAFPDSELHKAQLQSTLRQMHAAKMFKRLVFYLEACESGSMFQGMKIPGVCGLSASNPSESSWGTYCDGRDDMVNGKSLDTCLGDLFSVSWMEDSDGHDISKETLQQQFERVKALTNKSHVEQWGDLSFTGDLVSGYLGRRGGAALSPATAQPGRSAVSARAADISRRFKIYLEKDTAEERLTAAAALESELARQREAEWVYKRFAELVHPGDRARQEALRSGTSPPDQPECELKVHATIRTACAHRFDANSGFALQFHRVVVNTCAAMAAGLNVDAVALAKAACKEAVVPVVPVVPSGPGGAEAELVV